jgi:hypothetical protein
LAEVLVKVAWSDWQSEVEPAEGVVGVPGRPVTITSLLLLEVPHPFAVTPTVAVPKNVEFQVTTPPEVIVPAPEGVSVQV